MLISSNLMYGAAGKIGLAKQESFLMSFEAIASSVALDN
jgi:hypothetical protein